LTIKLIIICEYYIGPSGSELRYFIQVLDSNFVDEKT